MAQLVVTRSSFHTALPQVNLKLGNKRKSRLHPEQTKHLGKAQVKQTFNQKDKSSPLLTWFCTTGLRSESRV